MMQTVRRFLRGIHLLFLTASIFCFNASACTKNDLVLAIDASAEFHRMTLNKAKYGYVYSSPHKKYENRRKFERANVISLQHDLQIIKNLKSTISHLSTDHDTKVLFYGKSDSARCVWLIGHSEEILSSQLDAESKHALDSLKDTLGVTYESRRPRSGDECIFTQTARTIHADDGLTSSEQALFAAAQYLLPSAITNALIQDKSTKRLIIVPYDNLRSMPFGALPLGASKLAVIDKFAIVMAPKMPSITTSPVQTPNNDQHLGDIRKSLVIGDPDLSQHRDYCWSQLPNALSEAKHVAERAGDGNPLVGPNATFDAVRSRLEIGADSLQLIFFATHGMSNHVDPADKSFLALKDAHFRGADIRKLKKKFSRRPIVVMSACQTGLGKTFAQGMFGLIEAWQHAGASQVVASLWDVNDEGTALLMKYFAESLVNANFKNSEFALAEAMRETRKIKPHPSVWAAFNVYGEPTR